MAAFIVFQFFVCVSPIAFAAEKGSPAPVSGFISRNNPTKNKGLIVEMAQTKGNGTVLTKNQGS